MPVGLSDGTTYSDSGEWLANASQVTIKPVQEAPKTDSTVPVEDPTEPAGALKPSGGTETPGKDENIKPDYDYDSWQKANPGVEMAPGQHYPDTYKLPNHMTFSDESIYHGGDNQGGHWGTDDQGRDTFSPGPTNLQNHSMEELQDYFKRVEPNAVLLPPADVHPAPDYMNPPEGNHVGKVIDGLVQQVADTFKIPGDVVAGNIHMKDADGHTSTQAIEKATQLAGLMVMGPAPVASGLADGTLGSFMGVKSATIDKTALYKAQNLEMDGAHPNDIWNQTGTFKGADGRWRQEIPDQDVNILDKGTTLHPADQRPSWSRVESAPESISVKDRYDKLPDNATMGQLYEFLKNGPGKRITLPDVLDHPELYKAYPHLKEMEVKPMPTALDYNGMFKPDGGGRGTIFMNKLPAEDFTSTLMHEVQHAIQEHEGFASGGNPSQFLPPALKGAEEQFNKVKADAESTITKDLDLDETSLRQIKIQIHNELEGIKPWSDWPKLKEVLQKKGVYNQLQNIVKSEKLLNEAKSEAAENYRKLMGEVESRNVQARLNYNHLDRAINSPETTENIIMPRSKQINPQDIASHRVGR